MGRRVRRRAGREVRTRSRPRFATPRGAGTRTFRAPRPPHVAAARPVRAPRGIRGQRLAGYVEASHGCAHRCRHCPVPVVYDGRTRLVSIDALVEDISQLAEIGARHVTFGDPDFLNGPRHALRVLVRAARVVPGADLRCDSEGRARAGTPRALATVRADGLPVRGLGFRVHQRHDPRPPGQGPPRRRRGRSRRGAPRGGHRTAPVPAPRSHLGRAPRTLSTFWTSSPPVT